MSFKPVDQSTEGSIRDVSEVQLMDEIVKFYEEKRSTLEKDLQSDPEDFYGKLEQFQLKLYNKYTRRSDFDPLSLSQFGFSSDA